MATTDKLLKYDNFFTLCTEYSHTSYTLQLLDKKCVEDSYDIIRNEKTIKKPLGLFIERGRKFTDFQRNGMGFLVVSERVANTWEQEKFTGWSPFSVKIFDRNQVLLPNKYAGVSVFGRAGPIDFERSAKKGYREDDGIVILQWKGLYFDLKTWDGSDFFVLKDYNAVIVTRRVIEVLERSKFTGWEATPVKKYGALR